MEQKGYGVLILDIVNTHTNSTFITDLHLREAYSEYEANTLISLQIQHNPLHWFEWNTLLEDIPNTTGLGEHSNWVIPTNQKILHDSPGLGIQFFWMFLFSPILIIKYYSILKIEK